MKVLLLLVLSTIFSGVLAHIIPLHPQNSLRVNKVGRLLPSGYMYALNLTIGTPPVIVRGVLDTGSLFTWFHRRHYYPSGSSSYNKLSCADDVCSFVPGSFKECNKFISDECRFAMKYEDNTSVSGFAGIEIFSLGSTKVKFSMAFGVDLHPSQEYPGVIGMMDSPSGLLNALGEYRFSICYPVSYLGPTLLKIGTDASLVGSSTSLVMDGPWPRHLMFNISSIAVFDAITPGGVCVLDTGSAGSWFTPEVLDPILNEVRLFMEPFDAVPGSDDRLELCYGEDDEPTLRKLSITLELDGGASFDMDYDNLWWSGEAIGMPEVRCLPFYRGNETKILGTKQMRGKNIGIDHAHGWFYFKDDDCVQG